MIQKFYFWKYTWNKNSMSKRYLHPCIHGGIIYISQDMETTWVSTDERIKYDICTQWYYSAIKKGNPIFCNNTDKS